MKKLIIYSILVLCMIFSVISAQAQNYWNGSVDKEFVGTGTEADPYIISYLIIIAQYEKEHGTALDDIEEDAKLRPRKEMIDGVLYIIMPDGTKYTINGAIVK